MKFSHEAGKVVWYSQLEDFSTVSVIYTVKGIQVMNKTEVVFFFSFLNSLAFSMIKEMLAI